MLPPLVFSQAPVKITLRQSKNSETIGRRTFVTTTPTILCSVSAQRVRQLCTVTRNSQMRISMSNQTQIHSMGEADILMSDI